ncbi:MAG TPA: helix-turn-helix transcriptional regulator [Polyangiales bacterium]|jgi:DNA-binding XRE family transcriptional regulator|nr:helix-turn-helix transcriptional regulator [Polyangiales bacterium]
MSATIHLVTDRSVFEHSWRDALTASGLAPRSMHPTAFATDVAPGRVFVIDGAATGYDEDELLTAVGLARAVGATCAVSLPEGNGFSGIEDLLEDMCPGLVVRNGTDIQRLASTLGRRADAGRPRRFEYLTVSPRANELLALLGDGTVVLVPRPVAEDDDGSEVSSIELGPDAQSATLKLGSGRELTLRAGAVCDSNKDSGDHVDHFGNGNGANGVNAVDGARLGARLRELRLAAGLTQAELARRTGIHRPNIARVEAGRHTPSLETLARLASAIGVPTTVVLSGK